VLLALRCYLVSLITSLHCALLVQIFQVVYSQRSVYFDTKIEGLFYHYVSPEFFII
jgi:hypothetical protein